MASSSKPSDRSFGLSVVGACLTRIVLTAIFIGVFVPVGRLRRVLGWDPLQQRARRASGWAPPARHREPRHFDRMS